MAAVVCAVTALTGPRRGVAALATLAALAALTAGPMLAPPGGTVRRLSAAAAASGSDAPPEVFSSEPDRTWGTSPSENPAEAGRDKAGKVLALAEVGKRIFVGGEFAGVTPPGVSTTSARGDPTPVVRRPYLVALDADSGALLDWDAHPDGPVLSLAVSADGRRLYVGGMFRSIGGGRAARLAAVDVETGAADPTFAPPTPNAYVKAMALSEATLYVGGAFTRLATVARPQLAALNAATGALVADWVPPRNTGGRFVGHTGTPTEDGNPGNVADLKVAAHGAVVVIGGSFLHFGGRSGLIVLDAHTARATAWQPVLDRPRPVYGLDIWPGDGKTVFAAAGGLGGAVEAFRPGAGTKPAWVHKVDGDGTDVAATTARLYFVGHYDYVLGPNTTCGASSCAGGKPGDSPNRHIAAFDPLNGAQDTSFTAQLNTPQGPEVALVGAHHLYVGGDFTKVNFDAHPGFAEFAATAGPSSAGTP
ncbi:MAG: hypothetical protein QOE80_4527 [Actinomycetota bacterium]|nr:hypothetical protein [Actinomycetota bacterium]